MRSSLLALAVLLAGCSVTPSQGAVSFVINQQSQQKAGAAPGKSYDVHQASYRFEGSGAAREMIVEAGRKGDPGGFVHLAVAVGVDRPEQLLGKELKLDGGSIELPEKALHFSGGMVILQAVTGNLGRGSFNAQSQNQGTPWEAIGSFEALGSP